MTPEELQFAIQLGVMALAPLGLIFLALRDRFKQHSYIAEEDIDIFLENGL